MSPTIESFTYDPHNKLVWYRSFLFRLACDFGLGETDAGNHATARVLDFNGTATHNRNHISVSAESTIYTDLCGFIQRATIYTDLYGFN